MKVLFQSKSFASELRGLILVSIENQSPSSFTTSIVKTSTLKKNAPVMHQVGHKQNQANIFRPAHASKQHCIIDILLWSEEISVYCKIISTK